MRTSHAWTILGIGAALVVACSSDEPSGNEDGDDGEDVEATCEGFVSAMVDCGVLTGSRLAGCDDEHPMLPCLMNCVGRATCEEIEAAYCYLDVNVFSNCVTACEEAEPGPVFVCSNGVPIEARWRCDGVADCPRGEDEDCPTGYFTCDDGLEIPAGWRCDGVPDCLGGEDELDCGDVPRVRCDDGTTVPASRECDGFDDCANGEDELDCTKLSCG